MKSIIHEHSARVQAPDRTIYAPRVLGRDRRDGTWEAWIEFHALVGAGGAGAVLATDRETTQPSREALVYWATGLEPIYFEGALSRALAVS